VIPLGFEPGEMIILPAGSATLRIVGADDSLVGAGRNFIAAWREDGQTKTAIGWWEGQGAAGLAQGIAALMIAVAAYGRSLGWSDDDVDRFVRAVFVLAQASIEVGGGRVG